MTVTINGTTGIAGTNGSAGTPAVQGEDTNTGIFFPAADTVAVATAGAERLRVTSVGNVGVGTTSPSVQVHVYRNTTDGSAASLKLENAGATSSYATLDATAGPVQTFLYSDAAGNALGVAGATLRTVSNHPLILGTNNTERARIDASGNLLVGTTSSAGSAKMMVTGSIDNHIMRMTNANASPYGPDISYSSASPNGTGNEFIQCRDTTIVRMTVRSNGGIANYSANNVNLSDERVKTDIAPLGSYWDKIKALQVVTYKYLDQTHDDDNIGVIAQQVESVAPEFVSNDGFGETPADGVPLKSIYEADLHYATLKALQEAMARIEELTARVAELEAK